jgi:apolipoprotein D and lipocalin family protein
MVMGMWTFVYLFSCQLVRADEPPAAEPFAIERYLGSWYEIARKPNYFQRQCKKETTATYTLHASGKVEVLNRCIRADGSVSEVRGTAWAPDKSQPAKMKVQFFWPFSGPYWVHKVDPDYAWAIVGDQKRKNLWILSRKADVSPETFGTLKQHALELGYDLSDLVTPAKP